MANVLSRVGLDIRLWVLLEMRFIISLFPASDKSVLISSLDAEMSSDSNSLMHWKE